MKRALLVDGDIVIYKAAFGAEEVHQFADDQWASSANLEAAKDHVKNIIESLAEAIKADEVVVAISDSANWRKELYPLYKAPRGKVRRPILLGPLKQHVHATYRTFQRPTLEADDVLGILMTHETIVTGVKVIASIDKDLLQIPGRHININTRKKSVVTDEAGDVQHMMQTLTGDVVDNFPGCPGVGPKRATAMLEVRETYPTDEAPQPYMVRRMWRAVIEAFHAKGLSVDDALLQARVARICRASDYDFSTKTVRLWTPPQAAN